MSARPEAPAAPHVPVLLSEVIEALSPCLGGVFVDGTFGAGGYSRAILDEGARRVIAIDRDPTAIEAGARLVEAYAGRLGLLSGTFSDLDALAADAGEPLVDGVVLDVGVSSMQLDDAGRGFSFRQDGPLDMRMSREGPSAADLVNTLDAHELSRILWAFGEERQSNRIARTIVQHRTERPFARTLELASAVESVTGPQRYGEIHPATRTFQALRIVVNGELDQLAAALGAAERALTPGGRLVVVSFHSLEDRIVKRFLADRSRERSGGSRHMPEAPVPPPTFSVVRKQPVEAGDAELSVNPRARSAKLRYAVRTDAPAREIESEMLGVPRGIDVARRAMP